MRLEMRKLGTFTAMFLLLLLTASGLFAQFGAPSDTTDKTRFAFIPIPNYNEATGFGLGLMASLFYPLNKDDKISPASSTTLFGFYSSNQTWVAGAAQKMHLKEDAYRVTLALATASVNYQFYDEWITGGFIDYNASSGFFFAKGSKRVLPEVYLGLKYRYTRSRTTFDIPVDYDPPTETYSGLGPILSYDSRNSVFAPTAGFFVEFESLLHHTSLGSHKKYSLFELKANHYREIGRNQVLALRIATKVGTGDVPFNDQALMVGTDLRGYSSGKYRGDQKYTAQAEYRWAFHRKLGLVAFAGFGYVTDGLSQIRIEDTLPSLGVGIRYLAIPGMGITVGIDAAAGKDETAFYFRILEAF
jgi:outer membrane protein assembly factor BamA